MSRFLKSLHHTSLGLGLLSAVALIFNIVIFSLLYPRVTGLLDLDPSWESYGVVAAINIILIALYHLITVITLLAHLVLKKKTSILLILAVVTGIISGLMILGDITLLSDIGKEYQLGWQTRGEWIVLFISYGLHVLSLILGLSSVVRNLNENHIPEEEIMQDEVLFLSLHSTGVVCGWMGLVGVFAGLVSNLSLWMMERIILLLGAIILAPYLVILLIWLARKKLGASGSGLDEKQQQDLSAAGLRSLILSLGLMLVYFALQYTKLEQEPWSVLWLPLLVFLVLTSFSSFTLRFFQEYH